MSPAAYHSVAAACGPSVHLNHALITSRKTTLLIEQTCHCLTQIRGTGLNYHSGLPSDSCFSVCFLCLLSLCCGCFYVVFFSPPNSDLNK